MHDKSSLISEVKLEGNISTKATVILIGYPSTENLRLILFTLLVVIYCGTICGNLLIITLVSTSKNLHTPMYFFISQLSITDILLSTDIVPNTLHLLQSEVRLMAFTCCIAQYVGFSFALCLECVLLTVMSFDRFSAICNPLHYTSIMNFGVCKSLSALSWSLSLLLISIEMITICNLRFCGPYVINHFFCDLYPLLQFSCSDTSTVQLEITTLIVLLVVIPFLLIVTSYACIISSILKIQSLQSLTQRHKVFSTCSSHLTVVCIFYGTISGIYILPSKGNALKISRVLSLFYTVGNPIINPIVYSLRNKEFSKAVKKKIQTSSIDDGQL
ncbi:olfactory receptor 1468-like [Dendropsophus ebraccatus]|uniref:olfactory receptor 1468-like n=1 Tax=Dendropsophus ebraccatus TaxID=150705 RepID=UPI003831D712